MMTEVQIEAKQVIDGLGGTTKAALFCEVSKGAVSQWLTNGIPRTQRKFLVSARPELFRKSRKRRSAPP